MEPKQVLTVIRQENRRTPHRVVINTYAVIDGKCLSLLLCCADILYARQSFSTCELSASSDVVGNFTVQWNGPNHMSSLS